MIHFIWLAVYVATGFIAIWIGISIARRRVRDLQLVSDSLDNFFKAAEPLMSDKAVPVMIVRTVKYLSQQSGRPQLARRFLRHYVRGRLGRGQKNEDAQVLSSAIKSMTLLQRERFYASVMFAMISSAASDLLFSALYLRIVKSFLSKAGTLEGPTSPERIVSVALDITSHRKFKAPRADLEAKPA